MFNGLLNLIWAHLVRLGAACTVVVAGWHISLAADLSKIQTIVVLYAENRSFDHLYGLFPGANGIANATKEQYIQRDHDGSELPYLRVWNAKGEPDPNFPQLPNAPFRIDAPPVSKSPTDVLLSPIHAYYHSIEQINGGKNDMFAAMSTVGGYVMGYFDGSSYEDVAVGEGVHPCRQFLHGRIRWLLSQSSLSDLRLRTRIQGCARFHARQCSMRMAS